MSEFSKFMKLLSLAGGVTAVTDPVTGNMAGFMDPSSGSVISIGAAPSIASMSEMPGLVYWLDASKPLYKTGYVRCVADGDTVDIAPDSSGRGLFATVSATKPVFKPASMNGLPSIYMNGGTFTLPAFMTAALGANCTIVGVYKSTVSHSDLRMFFSTATPNMWVGSYGSSGGTAPDYVACNIVATGATTTINVYGMSEDGVVGFTLSPTVLKAEVERCFTNGASGNVTSSTVVPSAAIAFTGQDLIIGGKATTFLWPGLLGEFAIFNRALSNDEYHQVTEYLARKWVTPKPLLVCDGNSWTAGTGSSGGPTQRLSPNGTNFPSLLLASFGTTVEVRTDAYPGRDFGTASTGLLAGAPGFTDTFARRTSAEKRVAFVWEITNTLVTTKSAGATIDLLVKFCLARKAAGFQVVVGTCLPRGVAPYTGFAADALAVNAYAVANYKQFADGIVDFVADSRLNTPTNTTYFDPDQIHPNNTGYLIVRDKIRPVVAALLGVA